MVLHIFFGMGDCQRINQCIDKGEEILVYEPYRTNFENYKHLLKGNSKTKVLVEYKGEMVDYLLMVFAEKKPDEIFYETLDKYEESYPIELLEFMKCFDDATEIYQTNIVTENRLDDIIKANIELNRKYILLGKPISNVKIKGDHVFIVSAGSSLDKNIKELRNASGMILSTDTAANALIKNGIIPDYIITIDAKKSPLHFKNKLTRRIPLICRPYSNSEILKMHKGKKYFLGDNIFSGGSVSTDAIHIAGIIGYRKIVFVGLDLAITNNQFYADNTLNYGKKFDLRLEVCKDCNGDTIETTTELNIYRKWIERFIRQRKYIRYIDCTEGGAFIEGTTVMKLSDFIANGIE